MAKSKTLSEVYTNADAPRTPAMQKYLEELGKSAAARTKQGDSTQEHRSPLSDKDDDYEF